MRMGVLYNLFSRIYYPEIAGMFGRLDEMFEAIVENIRLERPKEPTDEDILAQIEKQADEWDQFIAQNQVCEAYISQAKEIYSAIQNLYYESLESTTRVPDDNSGALLRPLSEWFDVMRRPASYAMLLYYHQRIKQLNYLLELYQKGSDKETLTSRHLFEKGLLLLREKEENYLNDVYNWREQEGYSSSLSFITSLRGLLEEAPRIEWVKEKGQRFALIDKLNRHLKFADLAYRNYKAKRKVTDWLEPYKVHFAKCGGANIKGRFRLQGNMNGYVGYGSDKTIIIGFSGTELLSGKNWKTNIRQYFGKLDPVYLQAAGLVHAVWMGKRHKKGFQNSNVVVCGHSLGGGLMQYAVSLCHKSDMVGYGFNSAGLSKANMFHVWNDRPDNIFHLHLPVDVVFILPFAYQLGKSVNSNKTAFGPFRAHLIGVMRRNSGKYRHEYAGLKG